MNYGGARLVRCLWRIVCVCVYVSLCVFHFPSGASWEQRESCQCWVRPVPGRELQQGGGTAAAPEGGVGAKTRATPVLSCNLDDAESVWGVFLQLTVDGYANQHQSYWPNPNSSINPQSAECKCCPDSKIVKIVKGTSSRAVIKVLSLQEHIHRQKQSSWF